MIGDAQQINQAVQAGGAAVTAAGVAAGAAWVPIVGPIVAGVALALSLILGRKGPRQKVVSTQIVDELEPQLKINLEGYRSGPRTRASQQAALANFDAAWAYLISPDALGNAELGEPGRRGIADRDRDGKWDWFAYYRDPIANDPQVRDGVQAFAEDLLPAGLNPWAVAGVGLVLAGVML